MKACPFCAEQIQDAAIKCRFCGSDLAGRSTLIAAVAGPPTVAVLAPKADELDEFESRMAYVAGLLVLFIPVVAVIVWVALMYMTRVRPNAAKRARDFLRKGFLTGLAAWGVLIAVTVALMLLAR